MVVCLADAVCMCFFFCLLPLPVGIAPRANQRAEPFDSKRPYSTLPTLLSSDTASLVRCLAATKNSRVHRLSIHLRVILLRSVKSYSLRTSFALSPFFPDGPGCQPCSTEAEDSPLIYDLGL
ncbi:hypothetical protein GGR55DRAFT_242900 [Xylaria sp. FL0064]|nr:hypothetical protein GGR55DRAFT_242900 [Xylaria sp. FL0064]